MEKAIDHFVKDSAYPIISKHPSFKNFTDTFSTFWSSLLTSAEEGGILYEENGFWDSFVAWLASFSQSTIRAFRHTACIIAYTAMNSFISFYQDKENNLETLGSGSSRRKKRGKKSKKQTEEDGEEGGKTGAEISEMQTQIKYLKNNMENIMTEFFTKRYRDVVPDIRAASIISLGNWTKSEPDIFLQDLYTRYFGWLLNDRNNLVRENVLIILISLYQGGANFLSKMEQFTKRFFPRYVEMSCDIDLSVSQTAIQLCTLLLKNGEMAKVCKKLDNEDKKKGKEKVKKYDSLAEEIMSLVFSVHEGLRFYASEFAYHYFGKQVYETQEEEEEEEEDTGNEEKKKKKTSKKRKFKKTILKFEDILQFYEKYSSEVANAAYYIVEAFWDCSDIFSKNWKLLVELLQKKKDTKSSKKMEEDEEKEEEEELKKSKSKVPESFKDLFSDDEELSEDEISLVLKLLVASIMKLSGKLQLLNLQQTQGEKGKGKKRKAIGKNHIRTTKKSPKTSAKSAEVEKEKKAKEEAIAEMTKSFMKSLPPLLQKYGGDTQKLQDLLEIPKYFDLNSVEETGMGQILDILGQVLWKYNNGLCFFNFFG